MKTIARYVIAATALSLCLISCSKEVNNGEMTEIAPTIKDGFRASVSGTKITLESDFTQNWEQGDEVKIYNGSTTEIFTAASAGATTVLVNDQAVIDPALTYSAAYPASAVSEFDADGVTVKVPSVQHLSKNPFEFTFCVAQTTGEERNLAFCNVTSVVAFEITESDVNNVVIEANAGEKLTGDVKVSCADASFTWVSGAEGGSILLASDDVFIPGVYYAAVLPQTFTEGLTITITKKDGSRTQRHIKAFTLPRSTHVNLARFDESRTWNEEYNISTAAELQSFLLAAPYCTDAVVATLEKDIDLDGVELEVAESFAGTFDGNGKTIRNWNTWDPLFKTLSGTVKNLSIDENSLLTVSSKGNVAFIAGENSGIVTGCTNDGSLILSSGVTNLQESRAVGAIVAVNTGLVENCTNNGTITLNCKGGYYHLDQWVGGVVGKTSSADNTLSSVVGCVNNGAITLTAARAKSANFIGGVVGGTPANAPLAMYSISGLDDYGSIENCSNNADISVNFTENCDNMANLNLGGVAGYVEGSLKNCTNATGHSLKFLAPVEGSYAMSHAAVGGVAGFVEYSISDCSNAAAIEVKGIFNGRGNILDAGVGIYTSCFFGGVAGSAGPNTGDNEISNCHNTGNMDLELHQTASTSTNHFVGGVVAYMKAPLTNCSNSGLLDIKCDAYKKFIGGICGQSSYAVKTSTNSGILNLDNILTDDAGDDRSKQTVYLGGVSGYHAVATTSKTLALNNLKISQCQNEGNIIFSNGGYSSATNYIGGITGYSTGEISGVKSNWVYNKGDITIDSPGKFYLGGIVGTISCKILYAENDGDITMTPSAGIKTGSMIGGIAGTTEYKLSIKIDGDSKASDCGVTAQNCGYIASSIGDVTVKQAVGTKSGVGLGFGKVNGTGAQTVGTKTTAPQWHTSTLSGALNVEGDQARVGFISGGGLASALVCGGSTKNVFENITVNGTPVTSIATAEGLMGQDIVNEVNIKLTNVTWK